ncbi:MAG: hypothetical protein MH321_08125 [Leptospiraceae bacterium]|nr:hypothetical protein [Leptospiraceae bacterium]
MKYKQLSIITALILIIACKNYSQNENSSSETNSKSIENESSEQKLNGSIGNIPKDAIVSADGNCAIWEDNGIKVGTDGKVNDISFSDDVYFMDFSSAIFSKSNKYAALDFGTSPGKRGLAFINCNTRQMIYKDYYLDSTLFQWEGETFSFEKILSEDDEDSYSYEIYKFIDGKIEKTGMSGKSSGGS